MGASNSLPLTLQLAVNRICDEFESQLRAGQSPRIEDYLSLDDALAQRILLAELLSLEVEWTQASGQTLAIHQYRARFPAELAVVDDVLAEWDGSSPENAAPVVIGRFRIEAEVGRGSFGVVYRAFDPLLDRLVALKVLQPANQSADGILRFRAEARAVARLQHPNIVALFELGHVDGRDYISADYIQGKPLSHVSAELAADLHKIAEVIAQLANGLHYAHEMNVVHRDIKPDNILMASDGRPKLTDFGLAKRLDEAVAQTQVGLVLGTPAYMSPEQAWGDSAAIDARSDQYNLGVVLYQLLTGRLPYTGSPASVLAQVTSTRDPLTPCRVRTTIPRELDAICMKAMHKVPSQRYASCRELAQDLENWLQDRPLIVRRESSWQKLVRWRRHNPALAAALIALFITLTVSLIAVSGSLLMVTAANRVAQQNLAKANQEERKAVRAAKSANAATLRAEREASHAEAASKQAQTEEAKAKFRAYRATILLAQSSIEKGDWSRAHELLQSCHPNSRSEPDLRNWEWHYLRRQIPWIVAEINVPRQAALFAFSPDGQEIALQLQDRLDFFAVATGTKLRSVQLPNRRSPSLLPRYIADEKSLLLATMSEDAKTVTQDLRTVAVATGETLHIWPGVWSVGLTRSPDWLPAVGYAQTAEGYQSWHALFQLPDRNERRVELAAVAPWDREQAVICVDARGQHYSLRSSDSIEFRRIDNDALVSFPLLSELGVGFEGTDHTGKMAAGFLERTLTLDGRTCSAGTFVVVDLERELFITQLEIERAFEVREWMSSLRLEQRPAFRFSSNRELVWLEDHRLLTKHAYFWRVCDGKFLGRLQCDHVSPSGEQFLIKQSDKARILQMRWKDDSLNSQGVQNNVPLVRMDWSSDEELIAMPSPKSMALAHGRDDTESQLESVRDGWCVIRKPARAPIAFGTFEGQLARVIAEDSKLTLVKPTNDSAQSFDHFDLLPQGRRIRQLRATPIAGSLIAALDDGSLAIWNWQSGKLESHVGLKLGPIQEVEQFPLQRVVVGCLDGVALIENGTVRRRWSRPGASYRHIGLSNDGQLIAASDKNGIGRVWRASDGAQVKEFLPEYDVSFGQNLAIAFHPQEPRLLTGDAHGYLRVWDTNSWDEVFTLHSLRAPIGKLSFSPKGSKLAISSFLWGGNNCTLKCIEF